MNIFYLDSDPKIAASYHNDVHVIKMLLECAQLLCTAQVYFGNEDKALYRKTHVNHPCSIWIRESADNYRWLYELFINLEREYEARYGKTHMSYRKLRDVVMIPPPEIPEIGPTPVRLAMPDQYKTSDAVESYRRYYNGEKARFSAWSSPATVPYWFIYKVKECPY